MHGPPNVKFDRNLVKNNMWLNIYVKVHLLVYHVGIKHFLVHGNGTHEVHSEACLKCNLIITEISLVENFYISQDLESRGFTLQAPVLNGTCVQRKKKCQSLAVRFQAGFIVCINNCHLTVYTPSGLFYSDITANILRAFIISCVLQPCYFILFKNLFYTLNGICLWHRLDRRLMKTFSLFRQSNTLQLCALHSQHSDVWT
jgi:hypothetical protein